MVNLNPRTRGRNFSLDRKVKGLAIGLTAAAIVGLSLSPHFDRENYTVRITDKQVKRTGDKGKDKYLIFTELPNGEPRVFENTDSLLEGKWNSSDMFAQLEQGGTYELATYGWRIPFFSVYENIIGVREIKKE